jgi:hypothetical protein
MMKPDLGPVCAAVAVLGAALLALEYHARVTLRADTVAFQREIDRLTPLAAENELLASRLAREQALSSSSNSQSAELLSLRAEVAAQEGEIQKLRGRLAVPASDVASTPGTSSASPRFLRVPKESWALAGYATPESALQSMLWASREGDLDALRASLTPAELQRRMAGEWKGKPDGEIAADNVQRLGLATGFEILNTQMFSPDEAHFTIYIDGFEQPAQPLWMDVKRINGEWKSDSSEHHASAP